jgi:hypothetical protein
MQTLSYHRNIDNGSTNYRGIVKELHIYGQSAAKLLSSVVKHKMKNVHRLSREGVGKEISRNGRNFYLISYICKQQFTNMARRHQREYRIWKNMKARCYAPVNSNLNYQLNNITVCDRWLLFENFIEDMYELYEYHIENFGEGRKYCQLDRIDNNKGYSPDNCRFVTSFENQSNRECTMKVTIDGVEIALIEFLRKLKKEENYHLVVSRIKRGWDHKLAIETPAREGNYRRKQKL